MFKCIFFLCSFADDARPWWFQDFRTATRSCHSQRYDDYGIVRFGSVRLRRCDLYGIQRIVFRLYVGSFGRLYIRNITQRGNTRLCNGRNLVFAPWYLDIVR